MENKYAGMTVNERLYESGLMDEFDKAVAERDVDKVISILTKVDLNAASIDPILEHYGLKRSQ